MAGWRCSRDRVSDERRGGPAGPPFFSSGGFSLRPAAPGEPRVDALRQARIAPPVAQAVRLRSWALEGADARPPAAASAREWSWLVARCGRACHMPPVAQAVRWLFPRAAPSAAGPVS